MLMLSHRDIWRAIDMMAGRHGLTPSGLARRAGLDPTAFNPSKRVSTDGRARWPSTESIAKVLEATGETVDSFFAPAATVARAGAHPVPLIGLAQAGSGGYFDDAGFPLGAGWEKIAFPDPGLDHAYALEISGDSMEPVYRDGDVVIVAPGASLRRGDRVVAKTRDGEVMAKVLGRRTADTVELISLNSAHEDRRLPASEIEWIARIVWASQ
jgi:phage repressor protein C with HTH and peptisase S24 domain